MAAFEDAQEALNKLREALEEFTWIMRSGLPHDQYERFKYTFLSKVEPSILESHSWATASWDDKIAEKFIAMLNSDEDQEEEEETE